MTASHEASRIRGPIAIDGPAASGKSTVARLVAHRLKGYYISTGDMYRAISWEACRRKITPENHAGQVIDMLAEMDFDCRPGEDGLPHIRVNGRLLTDKELHSPAVAACVSPLSAIPAVREWLKDAQRSTRKLGIVVLEGRDIGTVIFPDTPHKFFLTATAEERARRRLAQGGDVPDNATIESVAQEIAERDHRDSTRPVAPLKPAEDAVLIDTSDLTIEQVVDLIVSHINH